jgi:hypothetical protein
MKTPLCWLVIPCESEFFPFFHCAFWMMGVIYER